MFVCVCLFVCLSAHLPAFVEKMKLHLALQDWDQSMEAAKRYVMFVCVSLSVCLSICIYMSVCLCVGVRDCLFGQDETAASASGLRTNHGSCTEMSSVCVWLCLSICLSVCICMSVYMCVCVCDCLGGEVESTAGSAGLVPDHEASQRYSCCFFFKFLTISVSV